MRWRASKADLELVAAHCKSINHLDLGALDEDAQQVLLSVLSQCKCLSMLWVESCAKVRSVDIRAHTPTGCIIWR